MKRFYLSAIALLWSLIIHAVVVEIDGIAYNINLKTGLTEVTSNSAHPYSGNIVIPETIVYEDIEYTVTGIGGQAFFQKALFQTGGGSLVVDDGKVLLPLAAEDGFVDDALQKGVLAKGELEFVLEVIGGILDGRSLAFQDEIIGGHEVFFDPAEQNELFVRERALVRHFFFDGFLPLLLEIEVVFFVSEFKDAVGDRADPAREESFVIAELQNAGKIVLERAFIVGVDRGVRMLEGFGVSPFANRRISGVIGVPRVFLADAALLEDDFVFGE